MHSDSPKCIFLLVDQPLVSRFVVSACIIVFLSFLLSIQWTCSEKTPALKAVPNVELNTIIVLWCIHYWIAHTVGHWSTDYLSARLERTQRRLRNSLRSPWHFSSQISNLRYAHGLPSSKCSLINCLFCILLIFCLTAVPVSSESSNCLFHCIWPRAPN